MFSFVIIASISLCVLFIATISIYKVYSIGKEKDNWIKIPLWIGINVNEEIILEINKR